MQHRVEDGRLIRVDDGDLCGYCNKPGTDYIFGKMEFQGQRAPHTLTVHLECEERERARAQEAMWQEAFETGMIGFYRGITHLELYGGQTTNVTP